MPQPTLTMSSARCGTRALAMRRSFTTKITNCCNSAGGKAVDREPGPACLSLRLLMNDVANATEPTASDELHAQPFERDGRDFLRAEVPRGDNRGLPFTVAQPLAGRYRILRFFS